MAAQFTRNLLVVAASLVLAACATEQPYPTATTTQTTPEEAARILGCGHDQVAFCVEVNCELEDYACTNRDDLRDLFKAGEFRH